MDVQRFKPLAAELRKLAALSDVSLEALRGLISPRSFAQGECLLRAGEQARSCHWIERGVLREYYLGVDGREHTRRFAADGELTGSLMDLLSRQPAVTFIQALEETRTLSFDFDRFDSLCAQSGELQLLARRFTELLYMRKARREYEMLALDAKQRYEQWQRHFGRIDARVSRKHLASYLGITPEHLSRLRRRERP
jgi:CRP-like cAMP-binding protein